MIDLHDLIEQKSPTRLTKVATSHGGEYAGTCIFCGGTDRFRCWPFSSRPHYWCRNCQKSGDAIQFLKDYCNLSYVDACKELGIEPGDTIQHEASTWFDDDPPCQKWQDFAMSLMEKAEKCLWSEKGKTALDYLYKRGLTEATIKAAQLGYVPLSKDGTWYQRPFSDWGLTDEMLSESQKAKGCVKVPNGILIPWMSDGHLWKLAVKRFEATSNEPKYGQVLGSRDSLYNIDSLARGKPVLLVEGEFDVLSAMQACSDLIAPIGTGSTSKGRTPLWIAGMASSASHILISFDVDDNVAGGTCAAFWKTTFAQQATVWPPLAHDVNDMLRDGKDIRKWVTRGLELASLAQVVEHEPQAPVEPLETFQGWLTRIEAEIDARPREQEDWCAMCDGDVEYYAEDGTPLCARCFEARQHAPPCRADMPLETIEQFAVHVASFGATLCDCTISILPPGYTLTEHIARLYPLKAKTWADFRVTREKPIAAK